MLIQELAFKNCI